MTPHEAALNVKIALCATQLRAFAGASGWTVGEFEAALCLALVDCIREFAPKPADNPAILAGWLKAIQETFDRREARDRDTKELEALLAGIFSGPTASKEN